MTPRTRALTPLSALTAAVLALSGCSDDGSNEAAPTAGPTSSPTAEAPPTPDASASTPPAGDVGSSSSAGEAALAFVQAVSAGDDEAAFALLTPSSQDAVGGPEGLAEDRSALAEGFGAFADADPRLVRTPVGEGTGVITLAAEVTREGMTGFGTATLPYREQDGGVALDLFDRAEGTVEFTTPERAGTVAAGGEVVLTVPADVDPVVSVDGQRLGFELAAADGRQQLRTAVPQRLGSDRQHVLTAAWTDADGRLGADAIPFSVG